MPLGKIVVRYFVALFVVGLFTAIGVRWLRTNPFLGGGYLGLAATVLIYELVWCINYATEAIIEAIKETKEEQTKKEDDQI